MIKILFVCHGNICRSAMAELIFNDMVRKEGLGEFFFADSAGTSSEELGNPVYPPVRRILEARGIDCRGKTARKVKRHEYWQFDLILGMDDENLYNMQYIFGKDTENKIHLLSEYGSLGEQYIDDPWYTRDFEGAFRSIYDGCEGLLNALKREAGIVEPGPAAEAEPGPVAEDRESYEAVADICTLDFSACVSRKDIFGVIWDAIPREDWYGENLDALYDILTGMPVPYTSYIIILPPEDSLCFAYAEAVANVFSDACSLVTVISTGA